VHSEMLRSSKRATMRCRSYTDEGLATRREVFSVRHWRHEISYVNFRAVSGFSSVERDLIGIGSGSTSPPVCRFSETRL
jgi:hypothetical protein